MHKVESARLDLAREFRAKPFGPQYLTPEPMEGVSLAAGQSRRELLRMSELVRAMLTDLWRAVERFEFFEFAQELERIPTQNPSP